MGPNFFVVGRSFLFLSVEFFFVISQQITALQKIFKKNTWTEKEKKKKLAQDSLASSSKIHYYKLLALLAEEAIYKQNGFILFGFKQNS